MPVQFLMIHSAFNLHSQASTVRHRRKAAFHVRPSRPVRSAPRPSETVAAIPATGVQTRPQVLRLGAQSVQRGGPPTRWRNRARRPVPSVSLDGTATRQRHCAHDARLGSTRLTSPLVAQSANPAPTPIHSNIQEQIAVHNAVKESTAILQSSSAKPVLPATSQIK